MNASRDTAFHLRLGAPEDMLITFDGLKRPVGAALHAIFAASHGVNEVLGGTSSTPPVIPSTTCAP